MNKLCRSCHIFKPVEQFYRDKNRLDGRWVYCKDCDRIKLRSRRLKNIETFKLKDKKYHAKHRKEISVKRSAYNNKNPEKVRARFIVKGAILKGWLIKSPCLVCGDVKSQAHHEDYNKPLDVVWLCPLHHRRLHAGDYTLDEFCYGLTPKHNKE